MKKGIVMVIASVAMALGLQVLCANGGGPAGHSLSYDRDVRPALESAVGIKTVEFQGKKFAVPIIEKTPPAGMDSTLKKGLFRAMVDVLHLYTYRTTLLDAKALGMVPKEKNRTQKLLSAYRDNLLSDKILRRALMPKVERILREKDLTCPDLPTPHRPPAPRSVTVKELMPYALAFLWPSKIRPDGGVVFMVCVGNNGIQEMNDPDPLMAEAAFKCVYHNGDVMEQAEKCMNKAMEDKTFSTLKSEKDKLEFLRKRMAESLPSDPGFVSLVKKAAAQNLPLYGLTCADCSVSTPQPGSARNESRRRSR